MLGLYPFNADDRFDLPDRLNHLLKLFCTGNRDGEKALCPPVRPCFHTRVENVDLNLADGPRDIRQKADLIVGKYIDANGIEFIDIGGPLQFNLPFRVHIHGVRARDPMHRYPLPPRHISHHGVPGQRITTLSETDKNIVHPFDENA